MSSVVVAGLNVRFAEDQQGQRMWRPVERGMITLATSFLCAPTFLAVREEAESRGFVEPVDHQKCVVLNRWRSTGAQRVMEWPLICFRIMVQIYKHQYLYVRLPSPWGFAACRAARILGRPYWVSLHGDAVEVKESAAQHSSRRMLAIYHRFGARRVHKRLIAATRSSLLTMSVGPDLDRRYGAACSSRVVFANFLHASVLEEPARPIARPPVALYVGGLNNRKGVSVLLKAATLLADRGVSFELRLVGEGDLATQAAQTCLAGDSRVVLAGWVDSGPDLDTHYDCASAFVLPSVAGEGVPKVLLEAAARRVPIIATDTGGIRDLLGDGARGCLVKPGDATALADALEAVLGKSVDVSARVEAAAEYMRQHTFGKTQTLLSDAVGALDKELLTRTSSGGRMPQN